MSASGVLLAHLLVLSVVSFGGVPSALPDLRQVVIAHGWMTDQDFANCFAIVQAIPGPSMILLTSFIGWQVGGFATAVGAALATFGPSCALCFASFRWWDRFRERNWQVIARRGLAPVTIGLIVASGFVMARTGDGDWGGIAITAAAATVTLATRLNPLWIIGTAAALGAGGAI